MPALCLRAAATQLSKSFGVLSVDTASSFTGIVTDRPGRAALCLQADFSVPVTDNIYALGSEDWTGDFYSLLDQKIQVLHPLAFYSITISGYFYLNTFP